MEVNAAWSTLIPGPLPLPFRCSHLPRRISAGSRHPCLVPAMARADLLIDIVRAGTEGNQELFRRTLEALISEGLSKEHHVATLPGGASRRGLNPLRQLGPATS